jgi:uncharacterized protein YjiS (DUF1127 family)
MKDFGMLPGSLEAGSNALLTSPSATQTDRAVGSKNIMAALLAETRRLLRVVSTWQVRAASRHVLASMSDRELRDIGLTRGDVERELMKPFWRE